MADHYNRVNENYKEDIYLVVGHPVWIMVFWLFYNILNKFLEFRELFDAAILTKEF